jgi:hypothetical protein
VGTKPVWLRMRVAPVERAIEPPADPEFDLPAMRREMQPMVHFSYSLDGVTFQDLGPDFVATQGRWTGAQIGLFATAPYETPASIATTVGHAEFDWFRIGR